MRYEPREETVILGRGTDLGDLIDLTDYNEELGRAAAPVTVEKRKAVRQACASSANKYEYLSIDVCAAIRGKGPTFYVRSTADVAKFVREYIGSGINLQEYHGAMLLDHHNKVLGFTILNRGTLSSVPIDVHATFRPAILLPCAGMIVVHNHPSDEVRPSEADKQGTAYMVAFGRTVGVRVLDHVIVGRTKQFSFAQAGMMHGAASGGRRGRRRR